MKIETSYNNLKIGVENGVMVARECAHCHEWLPASEFYASDSGAYGKYSRCKKCYNLVQKRNAEKRKAKREALKPRPHTQEALKRKYDQLYEAYEEVCKQNYKMAAKLKDLQEILER